jgi:Exopolysaccharide biosynthesis protein related to N-acetylglucosamine-1-phosphodiester alpha-N-acetylglucosaminidase
MHHLKKWICAGLCLLLSTGAIACRNTAEEPIVSEPTAAIEPTESEDVVIINGTPTPALTDAPTPPPTEEPPSPEPTATPFATRAPIEGDVCTDRFPNYDTGADADWSYQSDELRIAITQREDEDLQIVYYVADVWIRNINSLRMGFGHGTFNTGREEPESFAARENAILAINGTMNSGLVIHNGNKKTKGVENSSISFRSGIMIIYKDGTVKTINRSKKQSFDYNKENKQHGGIWQAFQFGPVLVQNGEKVTGLKKNERHPRTIIGYVEPGHYILVAVDGRTKKSIGITEEDMSELMLSLGCVEAMNLDGGNSSAMVFMGETINARSGNDRKVNDMILFAEYDADGNAPDLSTVTADKFREE